MDLYRKRNFDKMLDKETQMEIEEELKNTGRFVCDS